MVDMYCLYCPSCSAHVDLTHGVVVNVDTGDESCEWFFACAGCSLVTQVHQPTGILTDLGGLLLEDVTTPYVPGAEPMPYLAQQPTALHGRCDS